jgi:NAD(P)-dependent dehydrogenase (short-subunit alcohol dehydrogenase family)
MNKVVLITGASTGFGRTASETLAQRGYQVFATMREIAGRNASAAGELRSLANRERWNLEVLEMDVTDDASVRRAVKQAVPRHNSARNGRWSYSSLRTWNAQARIESASSDKRLLGTAGHELVRH